MSTSYTEKTHSAFHGAPIDTSDPKTLAWLIRRHGLEMTHISRGSHIGAIFSVAEIMAVLYTRILRVDPKNPQWENRDRLILSKGHAGASVYAALAERGFFPVEELSTHYANGSRLSGHVSHKGVPGVEFSTGSLGYGLSVAAGMALGGKKDNADWRVYCVLGDGECDEGSVWEAALQAHQFKLDNLIAIIDHNRMQSLDFCERQRRGRGGKGAASGAGQPRQRAADGRHCCDDEGQGCFLYGKRHPVALSDAAG